MRTLIAQSVHLRTMSQARLYAISSALIRRLNPDADYLLIDNASPISPADFMPMGASVFRFPEAIGHFSYGGTRDGPGRANMTALRMAMDQGYDRFCLIDPDCLVSLPVEWWFERMTKPVACQPACRHDFLDWQIWPIKDLKWCEEFDFIGKYDWENQTGDPQGEVVYADILGDNVEIIPVRGERVEGTLNARQFREKYAEGCDYVTHATSEIYEAFLKMNNAEDLIPLLEEWNSVGVGLAQAGKFDAAAVAFARAIAEEPNRGDFHANYSNVLRRLWRFEEAASEIQKALELGGDPIPTGFIAGCLALDAGQPEEAIRWFDKFLPKDAPHALRFARSVALLQSEQWQRGFEEFESRIEGTTATTLPFWDGTPGQTVAIHHEQGYGDTILTSRWLREISNWHDNGLSGPMFKRVYFGVPAPLMRLFEGQDIGPCELLSMNQNMPKVDAVLPLMSLPYRLGIKTVSGSPYLTAKHEYSFRRPPGARLTIGLVWRSKAQGTASHFEHTLHGEQKSIPLETLLPLGAIPGVALYSLQTGESGADIDRLAAHGVLENLGPKIMDFADMAGFMAGLDMVVSVDTAPAHLAGALGKPTIVLMNYVGCWQFGGKAKSALYDSVDIVRQRKPHDWKGAVDQAIELIKTKL